MTMTSASRLDRADDGAVIEPDETDPAPKPSRRTFTVEYKHRILDEYDALLKGGAERCALLRREGLYSSHISEWRTQRDRARRHQHQWTSDVAQAGEDRDFRLDIEKLAPGKRALRLLGVGWWVGGPSRVGLCRPATTKSTPVPLHTAHRWRTYR